MYLLLWVCGCVWLLMPQENQTELNKRRHSHPSQSLPIAGDDRQNADTTLFSNWIWDIIYSCFNMSGKSCGNNTQSLTFVLSLSLSVCVSLNRWANGWMNGEVKCDLIQILLSLCRTHRQTSVHREIHSKSCLRSHLSHTLQRLPLWVRLSNSHYTLFRTPKGKASYSVKKNVFNIECTTDDSSWLLHQ